MPSMPARSSTTSGATTVTRAPASTRPRTLPSAARRDQAVGHLLGGGGRGGDDADGDLVLAGDVVHLVHVADGDAVDHGADDAGIGVDQGSHGEAAVAEPAVVGEGVAQVA